MSIVLRKILQFRPVLLLGAVSAILNGACPGTGCAAGGPGAGGCGIGPCAGESCTVSSCATGTHACCGCDGLPYCVCCS
jgi:hypothetical protein